MYLEKLANGVNPLTNEEVAENDVVNNVRISRCLFYVSGILGQITSTGSFEIKKSEFTLSPQQLANFEYSQTPLTVSEITKRLNQLVNPLQSSTLKNGIITEWLTRSGMLSNIIVNSKSALFPNKEWVSRAHPMRRSCMTSTHSISSSTT